MKTIKKGYCLVTAEQFDYAVLLLRARNLLREREIYHRRAALVPSSDKSWEWEYWRNWQMKANCELEAVLAEIEHMENGE